MLRFSARSVSNLFIVFVFIFLHNAPSKAATFFNESTYSEFGPNTSPTAIGAFSLGTNSVVGAMPSNDSDWFSFVISPGTQLTSVVVSTWHCIPCDTGWSVNLVIGTTYHTTSVNDSYHFGINLLPLMGLGTLGPGTYTFGTFTGTYTVSPYQFDFAVESSVVPVPAALPLFATGLGALGLLGWRRKRKIKAAA
jgi:hypothetical protein